MTMPRMTNAFLVTAGLLLGVACDDSNGPNGPTAPPAVAQVTVTPSPATVVVGGTIQLAAQVQDAAQNVLTGRSVAWASGNLAVATVSEMGLVAGVSPGRPVVITATTHGHRGTATITVTQPGVAVAAVEVTPSATNVLTNVTVPLRAT